MPTNHSQALLSIVINALEDMKSHDMIVLNVHDITSVMDHMIIVTGTSSQHIRSIISHVQSMAKQNNVPILGLEGDDTAEWMLLDLGDIVVHAMLPEIRQYYELEKLWSVEPFTEAVSA